MSWWWQSSWTAPPDTPSPAPSPRRSPPRPPPLPLIHFLNSPPQVPLCSHLLVSQSCTGKNGSFDFVSLFVMFAPLLPFLVVFDELPPALLLVSLKSWTLRWLCCFFHFTNLCHGTIIFLWHLYFSFLSSFVSPASLLLLSSSPENPVNVWGFKTRKKYSNCLFHSILSWSDMGAWHFQMKK